jgi:hypothetical protein
MWPIIATVVGSILSLLNALILFSIKHLTDRLDRQDAAIADIKTNNEILVTALANCKVDCHRNFVTGEAFLRETGFMRRTLEMQTAALNRMEGQLSITEKLPEIVGEISRNIVREMKEA